MSILIPGMKMPKDGCKSCTFDILGRCLIKANMDKPYEVTHSCPLIELPPHGRLGDLDELAVDESEAYMSAQLKLGDDVITKSINEAVHAKIVRLIADTPTIIPAKEGEI